MNGECRLANTALGICNRDDHLQRIARFHAKHASTKSIWQDDNLSGLLTGHHARMIACRLAILPSVILARQISCWLSCQQAGKASHLSSLIDGCHANFTVKFLLSTAKGRRLTTNLSSVVPQDLLWNASASESFRGNFIRFLPGDLSKPAYKSPAQRSLKQSKWMPEAVGFRAQPPREAASKLLALDATFFLGSFLEDHAHVMQARDAGHRVEHQTRPKIEQEVLDKNAAAIAGIRAVAIFTSLWIVIKAGEVRDGTRVDRSQWQFGIDSALDGRSVGRGGGG